MCRGAGLFEQALFVAQAAGEPLWYLEILVDDCKLYDEALTYLGTLPRRQAARAVHTFGQVWPLALQARDSVAGGCMLSLCGCLTRAHLRPGLALLRALVHWHCMSAAC